MLITLCHWDFLGALGILYNRLKYNSKKGSIVFNSLTKGSMKNKGKPLRMTT